MARRSLCLLRFVLAVGLAILLIRILELWPSASLRFRLGSGLVAAALAGALLAAFRRPEWAARLEARVRVVPRWAGLLLLAGVALAPPFVARPLAVGCLWLVYVWELYPRTERGARWAWGAAFALALGARVLLVWGAPWPFWATDSLAYTLPVHDLLLGRGTEFSTLRTPGFPLLLLTTLGLTGSYLGHLLVAHTLGLAIAWAVARSVRAHLGELAGWLVFLGLGLAPQVLEYEQFVLAELPMVWALAGAAGLAVGVFLLPDPRPRWQPAALGVLVAAAILARPAALPLVPVALLAALVKRLDRGRAALLALGMALPLLGWAAQNQVRHGFFGLSSVGAVGLFGVVGHLVEPDSPGHEEIKAAMRPGIERHNQKFPFYDPDLNWLLFDPAGPLAAPAYLKLSREERYRVLSDLSRQAILRRPHLYACVVLHSLWVATRSTQPIHLERWEPAQTLRPPPGTPFVGPHPGRAWAYTLVERLTRALDCLPFQLLRSPLTVLLLLVLAWRWPRDRALLLFLAGSAGGMIALVCLVNEPTTRYQLQTIPLLAVGLALAARRWWDLEEAPAAAS